MNNPELEGSTNSEFSTQHLKFTEAVLEEAIIELFGKQDFPHVYGESIQRASVSEVLIKEDLRKFLAKRYKADGITTSEIESVIRKLENFPASDLYESNKQIMKMVADGFLLKREDRSKKDLYIQLIDYSDLIQFRMPKESELATVVAEEEESYGGAHNIYKIVNQLEIEGYEKRIPDAILYINGLPLVVFEFKSAIREEATIHDAYVQLTTRYRRDIPQLFKYNAFCVISDGVNNKSGSFFAPYEFFYSWAYCPAPHPRPLSQREKGVRSPHPRPLSQRARRESLSPSGRDGSEGVSYRANYNFSGLVDRARELRQDQTPAEEVMWELLRNRKFMNLKFRRQHQIGDYIVDFYCDELKLVIELDGEIHDTENQKTHDHKRDSYLTSLGFKVLRFNNSYFLNDPESILEQIADPHLNPLPKGEDFQDNYPSTSGRGGSQQFNSSPSGRSGDEGTKSEGSEAYGINSLYTMIYGLFDKHTLLDVIRNFVYFPDVSQKEEKIVCRYPQYYAATKLYDNILKQMRPHGDGKGGTYFGATGCGKSFTMLFLTRLLMKSLALASPTIVLITDRTDLDDQLSGQFTHAKGYVGDETIVSVESRQHLRELLEDRQSGGVFLTTIHKFTEDIELLTDRANVICISDEAHRSQVNLDQKIKVTETGVKKTYGFAKYLHDSLPNATYVGFTGTPIDATLDVFGEVVDSYTMNESVQDEITVRIVYEGRAAKVLLNNGKLEDIEAYYAECAEAGANENQIETSKKATAQMNSILGDPDRIKALAGDFVKHYETRVEEGSTLKGKAMFVCSSREIAYDFYKQVVALRPEWAVVKACEEGAELSEADLPAPSPDKFYTYVIECQGGSFYIGQTDNLPRRWTEHCNGTGAQWTKAHKPISIVLYEAFNSRDEAVKREKELKTSSGRRWIKKQVAKIVARQAGKKKIKPMERLKMIMTRNPDDPKELWDMLGTKEYRKELDRQFKNDKSNFKIAIVVDMWLTGFDVPFLDTIYIDKPIQRHNLIQTISRVNRKFEGKDKGLVVDYIGIKKQMNLALAQYGSGSKQNFEDINQAVVAVRDQLSLLKSIFYKFDTNPYFEGSPAEKLECLNQAAEFVQITENMEKRFMGLVKRLKAAYDICCGSEQITEEERDWIHFYLAVRTIVFKLTKGDAPDAAQMNARVREMIKEALESDGVEEIFKMGEGQGEVDIFSDDYMEKVSKIKLPHTKIKLLQQMLNKAIEEFKKVNKIKGTDFTKKFQALVQKYNERKEEDVLVSEVLEDFTDEIIDLYYALKKEKESFGDLGIDFEEKAFYDILLALAIKYDFTYPEDKLKHLAAEVKKLVDDKSSYTDWSQRDDIKAELKCDLIILLAENGYPPVDRDEVYKEIFEQAENFKKYQVV